MKFSQIVVIGFTLAITQVSLALDICLHARKGHSFVTVQDNGKVVKTLGLWPNRLLDDKFPNNVAINRPGDYPIAKAPDVSTCSPLKISLSALEAKAKKYTDKSEYGPYVLLGNNCTHFAVRMFNFGSGESFPVVMSPSQVMSKIGRTAGDAGSDAEIDR